MNQKYPGNFSDRQPSPFIGSEAVRAGMLTTHQLRTQYRALFRNVYLANAVELTPLLRARAAWLFAGPDAVLTGLSAAAVHRTEWLDPDAPAEIVRANRHSPPGLQVRQYTLAPEDVCTLDDMRVTTPARTAFDLARLLPPDAAAPILDSLLHNNTTLDLREVYALADSHPGIRGVTQLHTALRCADGGARTPLETETRLILSALCIPGLRTAIPCYDEWDLVCAHIAMGWPRWNVAVECDEESDAPRYREQVDLHTAELESRGWDVLWATKSMSAFPRALMHRVRRKLRAAQDREIGGHVRSGTL